MKFEIKNRHTLAVIFEAEAETFKQAVQRAVAERADLSGSDLRGSNLRGSDLRGSNLRYSDLRYSDLRYSDLRGAKIAGDITVSRTPVQIYGLHWDITIWDAHMRIGCQFHSHTEWAAFDDDTIAHMDSNAAQFWKAHKGHLLSLCQFHASQCTGA